jgi:hypothetical protein
MTYVKQVWTDTVTPVDKAHMDHIEDGIVAAVPADVVAAAATRVVASFLAAPDTQPAFKITGDGKIQWGLGGSTAPDISLSRAAVGQLQIGSSGAAGSIRSWGAAGSDNSFMSLVTGDSQFRFIARADGMHLWGPGNAAADIALFRVAANVLQLGTGASSYAALRVQRAAATDAALQSNVAGDTVMRWQSDASGKHEWGPGGSTAVDTSLYRSAASTLKTDGWLHAGFGIFANAGTANTLAIGYNNSAGAIGPAISFGNAGDTILYRSAASTLKTDGSFSVVGQINLGSAGDANLLRYAGNKVSTIGSFVADGALTAWGFETHATGDAASRAMLRNDAMLLFGGGTTTYDTNLYRNGAGVLKTDGSLQVVGSIALDWDGANYFLQTTGHNRLVFGGDVNANLYRSAASTLKTDGGLQVMGSININGGTSVLAQGGALSLDYDGTNYFLSTTGHNRLVFSGDAVANLYRSAAGALKTDGAFQVGSWIAAQVAATHQTVIGDISPFVGGAARSGVVFGSALDTTLYRSATNTLKTDGNLIVGGKITGADWTLICTQILGGTQANFDTNTLLGGNIPSTFTHLMIVIQANSTIAFDNLYLRVNNDGGANYDAQWLSVSGTAVSGAQDIAADHIHICAMPSVITAGPFASAKILISNYKGTAFWKSIQSEANRKDTSGAGNANLGLRAGTWLSTAAVTRLTLYPASGSFAAGSVFSLYGLS